MQSPLSYRTGQGHSSCRSPRSPVFKWATASVVILFHLVGAPLPSMPAEGVSSAASQDPPHRVVMHVNSGDEQVQRGVLNNVRHLYQALGREQLVVEVVVHGAGLPLLIKKRSAFGAELVLLQEEFGVRYTACSNTMKSMHVAREDLLESVGETVPAMVRLMERQEQGWAYIKP